MTTGSFVGCPESDGGCSLAILRFPLVVMERLAEGALRVTTNIGNITSSLLLGRDLPQITKG